MNRSNNTIERTGKLSPCGVWLLAAVACILVPGCSTPDVNPSTPRPDTGYVDFYTDSDESLSWEIKRASESGGEMRKVFSEFKPVQGNILRLAAPAGSHRFEVWFLNRVTQGPQPVTVTVENRKVTPVHVTLAPIGTVTVESKVYGFRPSTRGYARGTKFVAEPNQAFQIGAVAGAAQTYQPKERMSYFSAQAK